MNGESFFRSRWVRPPEGIAEVSPAALAPGFVAAGIACGIKGSGATDLGLVACTDDEVSSAMLLTRNASAAAPIRVCREECDTAAIRAAIVNSGNANAATGEAGYRDALAMRDATGEALGIAPEQVAVAETGTIGIPLPIGTIIAAIPGLADAARDDGGEEFATAIMTTDRGPKQCTVRHGPITLSAQAKGAGMIEPGFATMLCFVQTNAVIPDPEVELRGAVDASFERITVDGQMSTNDMVLLQATGTAGEPLPEGLLEAVLLQLALEIAGDGEGATRVGRIQVDGAADGDEAERVARAIANSPLVKTALHGRDPNWGRIAQAAGMALASSPDGGAGTPELGPDVIDATGLGAAGEEVELSVQLGRGAGSAYVYFSDLTSEYVRINSEYTT
jgi:glutamate N-acetyltransferase/amino-acid N-acetyltransferase